MNQPASTSADWNERCARRVRDLDPEVSEAEALEIAQEFGAFERTAKMEPEAAADFVHSEMARPEGFRFERRTGSRVARGVIGQFLQRDPAAERGPRP